MRVFTLDSFDAQPGLRDDLPEPRAGDNELLVRVHASSVNPVDVLIAGGVLKEMAEHEFPVTLGRDFAGVVEQVGSAVTRYRIGDEVFGFVLHADPVVRDGSWAELIVVPEDNLVAAKPVSVDFAHAGAAPVAALSAMAALDALAPAQGENVLVVGAAGGVGSFFVQLAAAAGANVIAPALPEDHDYLRGLGVGELVDRNADVPGGVRETHSDGVDAILDVVSSTPDASLLNEGGRLASPLGAAGEGPGRFNVMAVPTPANLQRLAELLDAGTLRVPIERTYRLEQAGEALQALPATHTQGKLDAAGESSRAATARQMCQPAETFGPLAVRDGVPDRQPRFGEGPRVRALSCAYRRHPVPSALPPCCCSSTVKWTWSSCLFASSTLSSRNEATVGSRNTRVPPSSTTASPSSGAVASERASDPPSCPGSAAIRSPLPSGASPAETSSRTTSFADSVRVSISSSSGR